ncbi:hypothetical protein PRIPAC_81834 [Pristionchus pacificus]|uniref:Uncharacterized protein n=1 Tax=Pristionchus pacificus TaxID=54126 RepID=A0A2A6CQ61_PRIPA|nr:hypothetical protein PRIPAC_81834 [Pristionchus pacificus]|eukprot:PDM80228.1 hypothetical protein PRIPAC_32807 [Pristionchus pacificus]
MNYHHQHPHSFRLGAISFERTVGTRYWKWYERRCPSTFLVFVGAELIANATNVFTYYRRVALRIRLLLACCKFLHLLYHSGLWNSC